jgi:hypothetical protein
LFAHGTLPTSSALAAAAGFFAVDRFLVSSSESSADLPLDLESEESEEVLRL